MSSAQTPSANNASGRPQSRGRESRQSRPTTPLRASSRESVNSRFNNDGTSAVESLTPYFAELEDGMSTLFDNLVQLQELQENISRFNESFSALLYGMHMNAYCMDFDNTPISDSFRRAEEHAREAGRQAALHPPHRHEHDAETTFMTNDTFIEQPDPVVSKTPRRGTGRGGTTASNRGGGNVNRGGTNSGSTRGRPGSRIAQASSRGRYSTR